jgi:hypothetical protein
MADPTLAERIALALCSRERLFCHPCETPWEVLGCPGDGYSEDGRWHWRQGCEDCQRRIRPSPSDGVIEPPLIIALECELRIEP